MKGKVHPKIEELRFRAEEVVKSGGEPARFSSMDLMTLIHELEVRQVELQMQNEELLSVRMQVEESRNQYAELYEHAPMGYLDLDRQGLIANSNIAARDMLGIAAAQRVDCPFHTLIHYEDQAKFVALMNQVAMTGNEAGTCELRMNGACESCPPYFIQMEIAASVDAEKKFKGWRVAFVDITERKRIEEELKMTRNQLEVRVKERTSELAEANKALKSQIEERLKMEAALQLYMKRLERSNQELQDFAFIASHDLQEPLRKIQAFGDQLNKKFAPVLGEEGGDYLQRMRNAAKRLQDMVKGLLDYSRVMTSGTGFTTVDLGQVVQGVVSDLEWQIQKHGAKVAFEDLPTVEADPNQMRQLFQNLISNSLRFRGEEPCVIKIHGTPGSSKQNGCEHRQIFFEDNGIGFEQEHAERIFALFERLHGRSAYEGTGMGLAICKRITEHHGGTILAQGTPGKGATFTITLPAKQKG